MHEWRQDHYKSETDKRVEILLRVVELPPMTPRAGGGCLSVITMKTTPKKNMQGASWGHRKVYSGQMSWWDLAESSWATFQEPPSMSPLVGSGRLSLRKGKDVVSPRLSVGWQTVHSAHEDEFPPFDLCNLHKSRWAPRTTTRECPFGSYALCKSCVCMSMHFSFWRA